MGLYMKVTDKRSSTLRGDANVAEHSGWITVDSFDFGEAPSLSLVFANAGIDESMTAELVKALGADPKRSQKSRALFGNVVKVDKRSDISSPGLMEWATKGDGRKVLLDACTENGKAFYSLVLTNARVKSFKIDGEDDVGNPTERIELTWSGFELTTKEFDEEGRSSATENYEYTRPKIAVSKGTAADPTPAGIDLSGVPKAATQLAPAFDIEADDERRPAPQRKRSLEVDAIQGHEFTLVAMRGEEFVSRPFHFKLDMVSSEDPIPAEDIVGQPIAFSIADADDIDSGDKSPDRHFHGRVHRFIAGATLDGKIRRYEVEVVPWFTMLEKRSDCRVFQEKTVLEIVEQVFSDAGFSDFEKSAVMGAQPKLEYCVQYRETDFAFVSRLLEEAGIFYFFRHEEHKHVLVLANEKTVHKPCADDEVVHSTGDTDVPKRLYAWAHVWDMVAKKALLRDYNYLTPDDALQVEQASTVSLPTNAKFELFEYPGLYGKKADGENVAKARMQAEEASHELGFGKGNCDALAVGQTFKFKTHEVSAEEHKTYVITALRHRASAVEDEAGASLDYHSSFTCVPNSVLVRPRRVTPKPVIAGPQTAVVVGPKGEEIATDKYARVKVQFHWDRKGKKDDKSSCWIRVAQPLAGKGWGALALPRLGQEVVVEFLDGDPDRPLVTGSVYNETALPLDLPGKKNTTLLRTRSTKEGTDEKFNELAFDDTKDSEKVFFHAEKDFEREVEHDDKLTIGKDGDGSRTVLIEKDSTLTINKGNRTEKLTEGNDTLTIEKGDRTIEVKTGKETVTVKGDRSVTVQSGNQKITITEGKLSIEAKAGFELKVSGGKATIDASDGIEFTCKSSSVKLAPDGVTIDAGKLEAKGNTSFELSGGAGKVEASGDLTIKGTKVAIN